MRLHNFCNFSRHRRAILSAILGLICFVALPALIWAHPLGDFVVNRYSRLTLGLEQIELLYVVDMAEVPTFQERLFIDKDDDGTLTQTEQDTYLVKQAEELKNNLYIELDGQTLSLLLQEQSLEMIPGDGGLDTMRLELRLTAVLPEQAAIWQVDYRDENFGDRIGWQEVVIQASDKVTLLESTAPTEDLSQALTDYPENIMPPETNTASLRFEPQGFSGSEQTSITVPAVATETDQSILETEDTGFVQLINSSLATPGAIIVVVLAAFGWGAAHALTPGHGKAIVGAYLVGSRGTIKHALFLGLTTTVTHTAGVFAVGLLTLFASRYILPEQLYPWLGVGSGILVILIGLSLFRGRLSNLTGQEEAATVDHDHSEMEYGVVHSHGGGPAHSHLPPGATDEAISWRNLLALGVSGGLIPCPSALILMLSAIAVQRIGLGIMLIIVFSLGLAGVLTAIGIVWVKARQLLERMPKSGQMFAGLPGRKYLGEALPALSALFITVVGVGITVQALMQTNML